MTRAIVTPRKKEKETPTNRETIPAGPALLILLRSAPMAVATTEKSLNMDPPRIAIPEKRGISAMPFLFPSAANNNPNIMANATPGIFFRMRCLEIQKDKAMITPTDRKAKINPFADAIFSINSLTLLCYNHILFFPYPGY